MKINKLSYRVEEEKESTFPGLWIELLIDEKPVDYLKEIDSRTIPQYYFENTENDLPKPSDNYQNKKIHLFGVCSCGIDDCGSAICEINKSNNLVNLEIKLPEKYNSETDYKFAFSRENYDAVIQDIKEQIKKYNQ